MLLLDHLHIGHRVILRQRVHRHGGALRRRMGTAATATVTARVLGVLDGLGIARALHNEAQLVKQFGLEVDLGGRVESQYGRQQHKHLSSTCTLRKGHAKRTSE